MLKFTKKLSTSDYIYENMKQEIIELKLEPNEQLVEASLADKYDVSRTPLRQALYRLELEGLVVKRTNGRLKVAPMSEKEAMEIYQVREVIEGLIAREATINLAKSKDFDSIMNKLKDVVYLMRKAAETERQSDIVVYGSEFHHLLEKYSKNLTVATMLKQINNRVARYRRLGAYRDPAYPSIVPVEEHENILEHIMNKDELAAETAMRAHIVRSLKNTVSAISYFS